MLHAEWNGIKWNRTEQNRTECNELERFEYVDTVHLALSAMRIRIHEQLSVHSPIVKMLTHTIHTICDPKDSDNTRKIRL